MKWALLALVVVAIVVAVAAVGMVGIGSYYCTPPIGHITPMTCTIPLPPGFPVPH